MQRSMFQLCKWCDTRYQSHLKQSQENDTRDVSKENKEKTLAAPIKTTPTLPPP